MKRIFYGVAGDGLGHACRAKAIIESLSDEYEVHIFTFGQALQFFKDEEYPHLHEIDGIMWHTKSGGVSILKTVWKHKKLIFDKWDRNRSNIHRMGIDLRPDLYISDFEPSIARTAERARIPLLSIDNQHRFSHCYKKELSWHLRVLSTIIGAATDFLVPDPDRVIVTTFHKDELEPVSADYIDIVDSLIRPSVAWSDISDQNFVLVYAREDFSKPILKSLLNFNNTQFKIYGTKSGEIFEELSQRDNFEFFDISPEFTKDIASCSKIIAPSGHQLISEAKYCGKPILTIPQHNQWEQYVNAYYVEKLKIGKMCHSKDLTHDVVDKFLKEDFSLRAYLKDGTREVVEIINSYF